MLMNTGTSAWLVLNGVVLVVLAVVLGGWAGAHPQVRRRAVIGAACLTLAVVLLLVLFRPAQVPTGWITVLQEGRSLRNVRQLYGQTTHAGRGFQILVALLGGLGMTTLPVVVYLNICLAFANTIIFFFLASYVLQSWWGSLA